MKLNYIHWINPKFYAILHVQVGTLKTKRAYHGLVGGDLTFCHVGWRMRSLTYLAQPLASCLLPLKLFPRIQSDPSSDTLTSDILLTILKKYIWNMFIEIMISKLIDQGCQPVRGHFCYWSHLLSLRDKSCFNFIMNTMMKKI